MNKKVITIAFIGLFYIPVFVNAQELPQYKITPNDTAFVELKKIPEFPGGTTAYAEFLSNNLKYPKEAIASKTEGKVLISIIVHENGEVTHPIVLRSLSPETDEEALRIFKLMPNFIPASYEGKPVKARIVLPVPFILNQDKKKSKK
jgi:TonB family protein